MSATRPSRGYTDATTTRLGVLLVAVVLGLVVGRQPVAGFAVVVLAGVAYLLVRHPMTLVVVLLTSHLARWANLPIPDASVIFYAQKALWLVLLLRLIVRRPGNVSIGVGPVAVLGLMALTTYSVASPLPGISPSQTVQSAATLVLPWLAASVVLTTVERRVVLRVLTLVPSLSVLLSLVLLAAGVAVRVFQVDQTGENRLSGATIPAYLAGLSMLAVVAGAVRLRDGDRALPLLAVNLIILMLTGGRGAILCAAIALVPAAVHAVNDRRTPSATKAIRGIMLLLGAGLLLAVFLPAVLSRNEDAQGFNSSGRLDAWRFFLGLANDNVLFGRGLGSGPLASAVAPEGLLSDTFVAQHSEYVRLILEGGYVGCIAFVVAAIVAFSVAARRPGSRIDAYYVGFFALGFAVYSFTDNTLTDFQLGVGTGLLLACMAASPRLARETAEPMRGNLLEVEAR